MTPFLLLVWLLVSGSAVAQRLDCPPSASPPASRVDTTDRLTALRGRMRTARIDAYIVLSNDDHQSEYVALADARREFISGFSGSSGWAVITLTQALLWTDSRYYLQADQQLDCNWQLMRDGQAGVPSAEAWLVDNLQQGATVSIDSKTVPNAQWEATLKIFEPAGIALRDVTPNQNLVDFVWGTDRPEHPSDVAVVLDETLYAGETWRSKVNKLAVRVSEAGGDAIVVSALDEVVWLLNIRGRDIPYTPVVRSYVTVELNGANPARVTLYVDLDKMTPAVRTHLRVGQTNGVVLKEYQELWTDLDALNERISKVVLSVRFSYNLGTSRAIHEKFDAEKVVTLPSPVSVMKGIKNPVEAEGMRLANLRDSAALVRFLAKLEAGVKAGEEWDELKASQEVAAFRASVDLFQDLSFESVSASGANSALPHYGPTADTNSPINMTAVYTLDSGGNYLDGTTDVTRTMFYGTPEDIHREVYTRLLSGCITLGMAVFPLGLTQGNLDVLVREPLYAVGMDYGHGSGHGIGHYGNVHEAYNTTLSENYFGSQEPGFYQADDFGMRLENIVTVKRKDFEGEYVVDKTFLEFFPVTLVPYETNLIDVALLNEQQVQWLNAYHDRVKAEVTPLLGNDPVALAWMEARTQHFNWRCSSAPIAQISFLLIPIIALIRLML